MSDETITLPLGLNGGVTSAQVRRSAELINDSSGVRNLLIWLADQMDAQHPPRMDEPGWGERVVAGTRSARYGTKLPRRAMLHWTAFPEAKHHAWRDLDGREYAWGELTDPKPWDSSEDWW